ncbi:hypothetical protein GQR58_004857 [Nymphon striatum]|nr:hypothetical protein GQR58_004857 [Nymphon striatum]
MNTAGTMDCKLVQSLKDYPFHQAYLPQEVCINDQCHDCIKNWVGYFIGQDNIIRKYDSTKTIGRKTPTNGTTSRMSANGSRQATTFHCMDLDLQSCACNDVPCTGTDEYCNLMEYSTSSCKCEIVLEDMHVMVMETNPEHNLKIHDGKSSRKKEDEEEMDKTRQQPTTKGDKTRKQPGTEIRRLQVIDKTKDDGGKDVTCVTINKLRDLCSAVNQIRQEGLCSAVNQITLTEGDFNPLKLCQSNLYPFTCMNHF